MTLVTFLTLLVGVIATVILLVVLLRLKCRQSKGQWDLPRDPSLYSTADHSYATVYAGTEHYDTIREGTGSKGAGVIVPSFDVSSGENGYQELMESAIQRTTYAHLYSTLPLSKGELAGPGTKDAVDVTETEWKGEDTDRGEGDEQEYHHYINTAYGAVYVQR